MGKRKFPKFLLLFLGVYYLLPFFDPEVKAQPKLVGQETLFFSLPSNQDRLVEYLKDYYGKYHLVMTFFPAAFTPV